MSLYAIGDLHLSFGQDKPMDIFGGRWKNHVEKIKEGFASLGDEDVTVLCGDLSWAMSLENAVEDFRFIEELPGKKIILKGNHDYWWSSATKIQNFFDANGFSSISMLHNNCHFYGENVAVCGSRGWFYEEERGSAHDKKLIDREAQRLETSLKAAGEREKYVFLHYPPKYGNYLCRELLELLKSYHVRVCASGHLHADSLKMAFNGLWEGTRHLCVSGDAVNFAPVKIR